MQQNSEEWLLWRRGGIGSSDAPIIAKVSPYDTPYGLWMKKTGRAPETVETVYMRRGKENEPLARAAYEERTGHIVQPACLTHPKYEWMRASTDGGTFDKGLGLEIKNNSRERHEQAKAGEVPAEHLPQCDHLLAVAGWAVLHYFSYREDDPNGALVEVYPSSDRIAKLIQLEAEFWAYVLSDQPPPLTDRDTVTRTDEPFLTLAAEWKKAQAIRVEWQAKEEAAREALIAQQGDTPRVTGGGISLTRFWKKGNVQYQNVPELRGVNLDQYRAPSRQEVRLTLAKGE